MEPDLTIHLGPLKLNNPVMTASGTFGYGQEYETFVDPGQLGALVVKGISLQPRQGNPPPRIVETPAGMLNAIGLANIGAEAFIKERLPLLRDLGATVIVNIYGHRLEDYGDLAALFKGVSGVDALEVNISCPNVAQGGMAFGVDPKTSEEVTRRVVESTDKPVIVKLTPNVTDITVIAKAVADGGAHAISLINTLTGMAIDIDGRTPKLSHVWGGLSGPAIRPVALYMVYRVVQVVDIPVIGVGGIMDYRNALEFLIAGAKAFQVGTVNFVKPGVTLEILEGIRRFCKDKGIESLEDLIGTLKTGPKS
jgi:dihydroorotate dehydrogenase (NAD+) catalytic subunit